MIGDFFEVKNNPVLIINSNYLRIIQKYTFIYANEYILFSQNENIFHNFEKSKIIIISQVKEHNNIPNKQYFIISFNRTIIIVEQNSLFFLNSLFTAFSELKICFLENSKDLFIEQIKINFQEVNITPLLEEEIYNFNQIISRGKIIKQKSLEKMWKAISPCILGYLIYQSYQKLNEKRNNKINNFKINMNENEFIILRLIGCGILFSVFLIYHIEREEFFAIKIPKVNNQETDKLMKREIENYTRLNHPLFPKFYGIVNNKNYPIIEFFNCYTLDNISKMNLTIKDKFTIIFEIMHAIKYIHENNLILRDLKPNNIMIDNDKKIYLIDFDRMIHINDIKRDEINTNDFSTVYVAPEVNTNNFSFECDIYSLGQLMYYIMKERTPNFENKIEKNKFSSLNDFYKRCVNTNAKERPKINEIIFDFFAIFYSQILLEKIQNIDLNYYYQIKDIIIYSLDHVKNDYYVKNRKSIDNTNYQLNQYVLSCFYQARQTLKINNKVIHYMTLSANQNCPIAQITLAVFYMRSLYTKQDIDKVIHYLSLAAKQNVIRAQISLGSIYFLGEFVAKDLAKAIYYFTLVANQNSQEAQIALGEIYSENLYDCYDINKAIYYYSMAADNDNVVANYNLGVIYYEHKYINKSIFYFSRSAKYYYPHALFNLGVIYMDGKYINQNLEKAIYYFTLAAKQNLVEAEYQLCLIYKDPNCLIKCATYPNQGKKIIPDLCRSFYYCSLAAEKNFGLAQFEIGKFYYYGIYVKTDVSKAIKYFILAADKNIPEALFYLGEVYYEGKYVQKSISKSIYYYSEAAKRNFVFALIYLGIIYYEGKYVTKNMDKALYYFEQSALNNFSHMQFFLGMLYIFELNEKRKGIQFILESSKNGFHRAHYTAGCLYHFGDYMKRDISKAILYYKKASSFNDEHAKNNIGVIYKHGFNNEITKNIGASIIYFNEAIQQKNDLLSLYNLAHLYLYENPIDNSIDKAIELLIKTLKYNSNESKDLLILAMYKKVGCNFDRIYNEFLKYKERAYENTLFTYQFMILFNFENKKNYEDMYQYYKTQDFLYDINFHRIQSNNIFLNDKNQDKSKSYNINEYFYEGFGIDL